VLAGHLDVPVHQDQLGPERADPVELGRGRRARCHHRHVQATATTRPSQRLTEVSGARADRGPYAGIREQGRHHLGPPALEAANRVGRFQLDAHRATECAFQRLAAIQRSIEKHRVDHPARRPDSVEIQTRRGHGKTTYRKTNRARRTSDRD
jgi:hypothetical protein